MPVGSIVGVSALVLSTISLLPLFQLWPKLRKSDSLVCPNSNLRHNSVDKGTRCCVMYNVPTTTSNSSNLFPVDGVVHRNIGTFLYIFSSRFGQ